MLRVFVSQCHFSFSEFNLPQCLTIDSTLTVWQQDLTDCWQLAEMSDTSSDAESSCGWTIISNEVRNPPLIPVLFVSIWNDVFFFVLFYEYKLCTGKNYSIFFKTRSTTFQDWKRKRKKTWTVHFKPFLLITGCRLSLARNACSFRPTSRFLSKSV